MLGIKNGRLNYKVTGPANPTCGGDGLGRPPAPLVTSVVVSADMGNLTIPPRGRFLDAAGRFPITGLIGNLTPAEILPL